MMKIDHKPNAGRKKDTEYYHEIIDNVLYLEIQGTERFKNSPIDWFLNFLALPVLVKCGGVWTFVHLGLWIKYKLIKKELVEVVKADVEYIEFCSYSQGAAIQMYFILDYLYKIDTQVLSMVCGCPRLVCGNYDTLERRAGNTLNIQYQNDIVTKVPFWFKSLGIQTVFGIRDKKLSFKDHDILHYKTILRGFI